MAAFHKRTFQTDQTFNSFKNRYSEENLVREGEESTEYKRANTLGPMS